MIKIAPSVRARANFAIAEKLAGRRILRKVEWLRAWRAQAPGERIRRTSEALARSAEYAGQEVPYYRELFRRIRFDPAKIRADVRYFYDLPLLTKETILNWPKLFISDRYSKDDLIERKTSGSTGLTLSFYYSKEDLDWASAVNLFLNEAVARDLSRREVHLSFADPHRANAWDRVKEQAKLFAVNRASIKIADLTQASIVSALRALRRESPYLVYGLPSTLRALIQLSPSPEAHRGTFQCFVSSGETLDIQTAELIQRTVACSIVNRYGNAEFGAVAQSAGSAFALDFVDGIVHPESLEIHRHYSEIVLSTLVGRAMPLLRYRTGDLGDVTAGPEGLFRLNDIQGRLHDLVEIGGKRYATSFFRDLLHRSFSIHDFQIVQRRGAAPQFRIVTDYPEQLPAIRDTIARVVGTVLELVRVRPTELIRKGRQMKFSYYVTLDEDAL